MISLLNEALYSTFEIFSIDIPIHYDDTTNLKMTDLEKLCSLQALFDKCMQGNTPISYKRTSLSIPELSSFVCNSQSKNNSAIIF
jgi:hypothetical protein